LTKWISSINKNNNSKRASCPNCRAPGITLKGCTKLKLRYKKNQATVSQLLSTLRESQAPTDDTPPSIRLTEKISGNFRNKVFKILTTPNERDELNRLWSDFGGKDSFDTAWEDWQSKTATIQAEIDSYQYQKEELEKSVSHAKKKNQDVFNRRDDKRCELKTLDSKLAQHEERFATLKNEIDEYRASIKKVEQKKKHAKTMKLVMEFYRSTFIGDDGEELNLNLDEITKKFTDEFQDFKRRVLLIHDMRDMDIVRKALQVFESESGSRMQRERENQRRQTLRLMDSESELNRKRKKETGKCRKLALSKAKLQDLQAGKALHG
jgi:multidrug resistance efflux pump